MELPPIQHDAVKKDFLQANLILFQNYTFSLVRAMIYDSIDLLAEEIKKDMLTLALGPRYGCISIACYWPILKSFPVSTERRFVIFFLFPIFVRADFFCSTDTRA